MKREGRQHGMVRSYRIMPSPFNPKPEPRFINRLESPPTAGAFTKVSTKPTNHSKFTGKCGRPKCSDCHIHPACKSKAKTKGTQKLRSSSDVSSNYSLASWRLVDAKPAGLKKFSGSSATRILDDLSSDDDTHYLDHDDHDDDVGNEFYESVIESPAVELIESAAVELKDIFDDDDDDDDEMSFCDLGITWENVDGVDEDWCLVENNLIV